MKGGGRARAGVLAIYNRNPADPHLAQDDLSAHALLASYQSRHRVADHRRLNLFSFKSGRSERVIDCVPPQNLHAGVKILTELHHSGANYRYVSHFDAS